MGAPTFTPGIRLHDLEEAPLERRLERACELGYTCVHLASKVVYAAYGIDSTGLTPGLAAHLRRLLDRYGLDVAVFGCYKNLATPNDADLERSIAEYGACARFASWLGAGVVATETGRPDEKNRVTDARFSDEALERFAEGARRAAERAAGFGMTLALEPGFNEVVCTPERLRAVLDAAATQHLAVLYDPVSLLHPSLLGVHEGMSEDEAQAAARSPEAAAAAQAQVARMIELCGSEICVLHAKDYSIAPAGDVAGWADGTGYRLVCHGCGETGAFDFGPLAAWAAQSKPGIQTLVENSTPAAAEACRRYLESFSN